METISLNIITEVHTRGIDANVYFVETCFTGLMDFSAIRYSAINTGLLSNTKSRFHSNTAKVKKNVQLCL
jgi:hypothetical protein